MRDQNDRIETDADEMFEQKGASKRRNSADRWDVPNGTTYVYIPQQQDGGSPVLAYDHHYGLNDADASAPCLLSNVLRKKRVAAAIKKIHKIDIEDIEECPVETAIERGKKRRGNGNFADMDAKGKGLWIIVPMFDGDYEPIKDRTPKLLFAAPSLSDDMIETCKQCGVDSIQDPDGATLVAITRTGKGKFGTRYSAKTDPKTNKKPMRIDDKIVRQIEKQAVPGGTLHLPTVLAKWVKVPDHIEALLDGKEYEREEIPTGDDAAKTCFGVDYDANAQECEDCDLDVADCRKKTRALQSRGKETRSRLQEYEDAGEEKIVEDEAPAPRRRPTTKPEDEAPAPRRRQPAPDPEDDNIPDDPPPRRRAEPEDEAPAPRRRPTAKPEPDLDADDAQAVEDLERLIEQKVPQGRPKPKPVARR